MLLRVHRARHMLSGSSYNTSVVAVKGQSSIARNLTEKKNQIEKINLEEIIYENEGSGNKLKNINTNILGEVSETGAGWTWIQTKSKEQLSELK